MLENLLIYGRYFGLPKAVIAERSARLLEFAQLAEQAAASASRRSPAACGAG